MYSRFWRLILGLLLVCTSTSVLLAPSSEAHHDENHEEFRPERVAAGGAPAPGTGGFTSEGFVRAIDGSTFELYIGSHQIGIGVIGIDVPEGNTICGQMAADYLQGLVWGGLRFEEDPDIAFDERMRRMYYAFTPDGRSVAQEMVAAGYATPTGEGLEATNLAALEEVARADGKGCFADPEMNLNSYVEQYGASDAARVPMQAPQDGNPPFETIVAGVNFPTSFSFFPDGRMLIAEKSGRVRLVKDGQLQAAPFIDISSIVNDYWDRGLLNVAVDPDFNSNGYVYLLFTYEDNAANFSGPKTGRLIRVTANGDTASLDTAVTLLGSVNTPGCAEITQDCIPSDSSSHSTGGIAFGNDGTLFVTLGEGAEFNIVDPEALRAQNLDSLGGKMLRITKDGQAPADNPFYTGNPNDNRSKVWAYGFRNAYRLSVNPYNGLPYVGDVGWTTWEEVSVATPGANLGWPCYEGPAVQGGFEWFSTCQDLYAQGASGVQQPLVSWNRYGRGSAVTGGVFINSDLYDEPLYGAYVYADYVSNEIFYIHVDENNELISGPELLMLNSDGAVDFKMGPDGYLYYLSINTGEVRRVLPDGDFGDPHDDSSMYLSDRRWLSQYNSWGPPERDMSNGEDLSGDGNTLSIRGTTFEKGIGIHAPSEISIAIPAACTTFEAVIGIDDEVAPNGSVRFHVYGDDMLMYSSDVLTGESAPEAISVDITGHSTLRLAVDDAGDNVYWDHADWADARFVCEDEEPEPPTGSILFLSDTSWTSASNSWGPVEINMSNGEDGEGDGGTLSIRGNTFDKGLGVHAYSEIRYAIPVACTAFAATIGIDDEVAPNGSVRYEVWGDETLLYASDILTGESDPVAVNADVSAYSMLRLVVDDGGDNVNWDHANWANARLICGEDIVDPPAGDSVYLSDMTWVSESNGYGPAERDTSNGEDVAGDGVPMSIRGMSFNKGVGVHAPAEIIVEIPSACPVFAATLGVDNEVAPNGSVTFQVWGDDTLVYESDVLTGTSGPVPVSVDLAGYSTARLVVGDGGDNVHWDHANWGDARFLCAPTEPGQPTATITSPSPDHLFTVGEVLSFSGSATDSDGNPIDASGLSWRVIIHHCSAVDCHLHQLMAPNGVSGGSIVVPDHGIDPWYLEIILTATQADGRQVTTSLDVMPRTVAVTLETVPSGLTVSFGSISGPAPMTVHPAIGTRTSILTPAQQGNYLFDSWSDGGARQHIITVGSTDTTLTATFIDTSAPDPDPTEDVYISDMPWISSVNGWGPVERDMANGEQDAGDGLGIYLDGVPYAKGIGVHAYSEVVVDVSNTCPTFTAVVGVNDYIGDRGSVRFEVYGDGTRLYQSPVMTGSSDARQVVADLTGYSTMRLVVTDGGDGMDFDHASWADAKMTCAPVDPGDPDPDPTEEGLFAPAVSYNTGTNAHGVIALDVTGDSIRDLLVADATSGTVSVFPGNGDGTFGSRTSYTVGGEAPKMVTTGDLNGDGILDLATANQNSGGIGILLGLGGGSYEPGFEIDSCYGTHEVAIADLNNDGDLDLMAVCWSGEPATVHLGNGDGTFQPAITIALGVRSHSLALADFNGDGNLDVVADDNDGGQVHILLGNGDGTFTIGNVYAVGAGPHGVRVADLNGDGRHDIVAVNEYSDSISVLLGNGDGTFGTATAYGTNPNPKGLAIGDVTGDGILDIVVANSWGNYGASTKAPTDIAVFRGNGDGTFAAAEFYPVDLTPFSVFIADLNGDGRNDVAAANWDSSTVAVLLNTGN